MKNPEDELPPIMVECPTCGGDGDVVVDEVRMAMYTYEARETCPTCHGDGEVEQDATDARDDALEARSHARREEGGREL